MTIIENKTFDKEREFYGSSSIMVSHCLFDGPADGESAFKECSDIVADHSCFKLRYPFWHDTGLTIQDCELTDTCRAALWYSKDITINHSILNGIKALRECGNINIRNSTINSAEFGWFSRDISVQNVEACGEYIFLRGERLTLDHFTLNGKYSFQYIQDSVLENCHLTTKDAFWHARNVTVRNSYIKGEYLAWYCENVTFENCVIVGTQPLCYCKGLKLINCQMFDTDLAFEKSEVEATVTTHVISIKNPRSGSITVPSVGEEIFDDPKAEGNVIIAGA